MINILELLEIKKSYPNQEKHISVLNEIYLNIKPRETVAIIGASGSGKSTLLHIAGSLDSPSSGLVMFLGTNFTKMGEQDLAKNRAQGIGFVFQNHYLIEEINVLENIIMPLMIAGEQYDNACKKAISFLFNIGMRKKCYQYPTQLSGGERQRVAIARATIHKPKLLIADEPTGSLDDKNKDIICDEMLNLSTEYNTAILLATHDRKVAKRMNRTFCLENGRLV